MRKLSAGMFIGLVIGLILAVPVSGMAANSMNPRIEAPANGNTISSANFNIQVSATSTTANRCGFSKAEVRLDGVSAPIKTWTWDGNTGYPASINESFSYSVGRNNAYRLRLLTTERFKNTIGQCTVQGTEVAESPASEFIVDAPPATPSWAASPTWTLVNSSPVVTLKWRANSEPDIKKYIIQRSGPGGDMYFNVTPGQAGCGGGTCTIKDDSFPGTGYTGTYSYFVVAFRNSLVSSDECANCRASSASSTRTASPKEPPPPPTGGTSGNGGSSNGGSSNGGSSNGGSSNGGSTSGGGGNLNSNGGAPDPATQGLSAEGGAPAPQGSALPGGGGGNGAEFFQGSYSTRLPYQPKTLLLPGANQSKETTRRVAQGGPNYVPPDMMRLLISVAGGLLFITLAAHARRMLRDR